jgi:hypothetical protein
VELVLLGDIQNGYASNWARIANTTGVSEIQIGDRFREQGFGAGAEELEVAGIDISVVGGASRLFFNRAANATQPEVHRLGAVLLRVGIKAEELSQEDAIMADIKQHWTNAVAAPVVDGKVVTVDEKQELVRAALVTASAASSEPLVPLKRGRGRPKGSKNKAHKEVAFPAGF